MSAILSYHVSTFELASKTAITPTYKTTDFNSSKIQLELYDLKAV